MTISIFAMMTALLVAKYGNFNQNIFITNLAYDVALLIRDAQSYGINVKSVNRATNQFDSAFGVHIEPPASGDTVIQFYADTNRDGKFQEEALRSSVLKGNAILTNIKAGSYSGDATAMKSLDISFNRPNPNAIIVGTKVDNTTATYEYGEFTIQGQSGSSKKVIVRSTGYISVSD